MRIEATYFDGFTEHLLRWQLEINNGKAYLESDWFKNRTPLRAKFRFDEGAFRSALPLISEMKEKYHAPWEDLETRVLVVKDGEVSVRRHVYGAGILLKEHPEIEGFLNLWRILQDAVAAHLPATLRV